MKQNPHKLNKQKTLMEKAYIQTVHTRAIKLTVQERESNIRLEMFQNPKIKKM